jgi:hypothetical protein
VYKVSPEIPSTQKPINVPMYIFYFVEPWYVQLEFEYFCLLCQSLLWFFSMLHFRNIRLQFVMEIFSLYRGMKRILMEKKEVTCMYQF